MSSAIERQPLFTTVSADALEAPIFRGTKRTRAIDPVVKQEWVNQVGRAGMASSPPEAVPIVRRNRHLRK
eukprot:3720993-Lingulodinium_polyedra.AAC.1